MERWNAGVFQRSLYKLCTAIYNQSLPFDPVKLNIFDRESRRVVAQGQAAGGRPYRRLTLTMLANHGHVEEQQPGGRGPGRPARAGLPVTSTRDTT